MFEEKLFQLLTDLRSGKHKVKKEFSFSQPDSTEESESFVDDLLFTFGEDSISCDIEWSYYRTKGMGSNDNLTPVDSDIVTLDYIDIENFVYTENEEEKQLEDLSKYPRLKKLFLTYIISLMKDNVIDEVDSGVWKYYVKEGISGMYLNLNQDKIDRMRQKVRILHSKYGTGSKEYEDAFDELHNLIMKSDEEKHDFYSGKLPKPKNENIKSFDDFLNEKKKLDIKVKIFKHMASKYREEHGLPPNSKTPYDELMKYENVDEGLKTWSTGILMALSLFTNTVMGGDIKKTGTGSSSNVQIAINKAKSNAISKIGGGTNSTTTIKGGQFGQPNIVKDKGGSYVVTIDFTVDSVNVNVEKKVESQRFDGMETKKFLNDIVDMGYKADKDVNKFVDKYTDIYDFKISKMSTEQIGTIGEMSIKLSKTMVGGDTVFCVVTPIGK